MRLYRDDTITALVSLLVPERGIMESMSEAAFKKDSGDIERPDIFAYRDYKVFLRNYLHFLKLTDAEFTYRKIAAQCHISLGYLSTILNTNQHITKKAVEKLIPALGLQKAETSYFRILCTIHESTDQEQRIEALHKLQKFDKFSKLNPNEAMVSQYFSKWYYVAVREMANLPDFQLNPVWIQKKLNFTITIAEVSAAVSFLLEHKLIVIKSNGTFCSSDERVICEGNIFRFILTHFHRQMCDLALAAIDNTSRERRNVRGHTICLNQEHYKKAKEIMDKALEEVAHLSESADKDSSVYHFLFLGYPLSRIAGGNDEK